MEWIFTFGFGHTHPQTGESLSNCFVRISAPSREEAREAMVRCFGLKWAFDYDNEDRAGVAKWNMREIPLPSLTQEQLCDLWPITRR